jgi:4,5-dihydroxyphthalate decarboxylase
MVKLKLSLACVPNYDRTGPLLDGTIRPSGIEFIPSPLPPNDLFRRMAQFAEFDVSEMSFSTFTAMKSRDDQGYVGLPIFPSRSFRHGFIVVNTSSGIQKPEDLRGKRVGVAEYQQTASLWIRGMLKDEYGVAAEDVLWFEGGMDENRPERFAIELPSSLRYQRIRPDQTLSRMLEQGELDAVLGARFPACFWRGEPHVKRLFPNYREVERDYFRRTGFFPVMHMVVVRRSIYEQHPWIVQNIYEAFNQAKNAGLDRLWDTGSLASALPWLLNDMEEIRDVFGGDPFPYGIQKNRTLLEYMTAMSFDQGLSPRKLELTDLFARETLDT